MSELTTIIIIRVADYPLSGINKFDAGTGHAAKTQRHHSGEVLTTLLNKCSLVTPGQKVGFIDGSLWRFGVTERSAGGSCLHAWHDRHCPNHNKR